MAVRPRRVLKYLAKWVSVLWLWSACLSAIFTAYVLYELVATRYHYAEEVMLRIATTEPTSLSGHVDVGTSCEFLRDTRYLRASIELAIPETERNINNPVFSTSVIFSTRMDERDERFTNESSVIVARGDKMCAVSFKSFLEKTLRAMILWLPRVLRIVDDFEHVHIMAIDEAVPYSARALALSPSCSMVVITVEVQALSASVMHVAGVRVVSTLWKSFVLFRALHRVGFVRLLVFATLLCTLVLAFTNVLVTVSTHALRTSGVLLVALIDEISLIAEAFRSSKNIGDGTPT